MKLLRSLLAAAALALPLSAFHVSVTDVAAQAQAAKPAKKVVKAKLVKKAAVKSCGEFKYAKGGKCQDARAKPSKD